MKKENGLAVGENLETDDAVVEEGNNEGDEDGEG